MVMLRAQSAMEYLTTYGWAILIIAVVLSAMYVLGLFSPSSYVNNECIFPAEFSCLSSFIAQNGILTINLEQSTSSPINITALGCNDQGTLTNMQPYSPQMNVQIGSNTTLSVQCYANGTAFSSGLGGVYKGDMILNYTDLQTGFSHTIIGQLVAKVQT
ncbi:MAG: hypothetical protein M1500_03780 [Candidatus Marsarchaeota archaeon]|nr:hypothetical protein [Candidatus Marsarchaeota archaeon]MCL5112795.1 hypothetical protein [Candidatus Marsarchaeota archaeon]